LPIYDSSEGRLGKGTLASLKSLEATSSSCDFSPHNCTFS